LHLKAIFSEKIFDSDRDVLWQDLQTQEIVTL